MLPEVAALFSLGSLDKSEGPASLVRIPPENDVPMTPRIRRLIDTPPMRRLASISQLGMVALVYPGATHSRLEHTLGVYHNALRLLARLSKDDAFTAVVDRRAAEAFVLAALLHDVGHWPFCHPIEDMCLDQLGEHEARVAGWLEQSELAECIEEDWECDQTDVLTLLGVGPESDFNTDQASALLASCLSGPIDVDKIDYLQRDSLHAGVPYGRNFDVGRLINSMCVHPNKPQLAVGEKGRTAAEMMVFSRYIMFSEVYWHHSVRAATAMLQRAVFLLQHRIDIEASLRLDDAAWISMIRRMAEGSVAEPLVEGIFGPKRQLYKRVAEYNVIDGGEIHAKLARRPYWWLVACAEKLAGQLSRASGVMVSPADVLIDAPPVKLEVDINIDVVGRKSDVATVHSLEAVSPVASALAKTQFDDQVKRVRVFVRQELRSELDGRVDWHAVVNDSVAEAESDIA